MVRRLQETGRFHAAATAVRRSFEIDVVRHTLGNARALGLFAFGLFLALLHLRRLDLLAKLHIRPVAATAQRYFQSRLRVFAEHLLALNAIRTGRDLTRKIALGIIRAADEGTEATRFQGKLAVAALRAFAARTTIGAFRENVRLKQIVERVEYDAIAHFLDVIDGADELFPKLGENRTPIDLARRNFVELFFKAGGEIVFDIAREEAF